ncbi:MAG TPA: S8 family serine peptidase [Allocoleopsis sp.]
MNYHFRSLFRFTRTLKGSIALGISSCLLIVGIATAKATAQNPSSMPIAPSALEQIQALVQEKQSRTPAQQKINSAILYTIRYRRRDNLFKRVPDLDTFVKLTNDGKARINIQTNAPVTAELQQKIQAYGAQILHTSANYNRVQVLIPLEQVESLAQLPEIKSIKPYIKPRVWRGSVRSEGDIAQGAALARATYRVNGTGVKVGVISDSYDYLGSAATDIANGDLPADGVTLVGSGDLKYDGIDEGRAMLQIIHDLAPGAKLYFATAFNGEADFANNIRALRQAGCDIIVDDIVYFSEPVFQDGIVAQAVNEVTASGALYFSSAGNDGNKSDGTSSIWEGDFVDGGQAPLGLPGKVHSFGSTPYNVLKKKSDIITLQWSDPQGKSANDYDLYVLNANGTRVIGASTSIQDGNQDPYEIVNPKAANSRIVIVLYKGESRFLHLATNTSSPTEPVLSVNTNGAIFGHAAAANAFAVAAVSAQNRSNLFTIGSPSSVEKFSSDGPRRIFYKPDGTPITPGNFLSTGGTVRQKPDIAASDGVKTTLDSNSGLNPFFGTSAAAPHAAGVAALLKSFRPSLTPRQIRSILTKTALDIEASGVDENSGYGIVMATRALLWASQLP